MDVAVLKLCYIDFTADTDGRALAGKYTTAMNALQHQYPQTRFVAATAPLTTVQTGPKAWIKILLGRKPAGYLENARRADFNDQLRSTVSEAVLFDLARLEATAAGSQNTFDLDGRTIESLDPALTSDGGHLNESGEKSIAAAFVRFLAGLGRSRPSS